MGEHDVIKYAREALKRGYSPDMIMQKLIGAGHDDQSIKEHVREAIRQRIDELSLQREELFGAPFRNLRPGRRR